MFVIYTLAKIRKIVSNNFKFYPYSENSIFLFLGAKKYITCQWNMAAL